MNFAPSMNVHMTMAAKSLVGVQGLLIPATEDPNFLSPETLIAFFEVQVKDCKAKLGAMMREQQVMNDRSAALTNAAALLVEGKGIKPGDEGWRTYAEAAQKAATLLGDSAEGDQIRAFLDKANRTERVEIPITPGTAAETAKATERFGSTAKTWVEDGKVIVEGCPGLSKDDVASMKASIKSYTDKISSDTTMRMIRVQQLVDQSSQLMNLCSNILKKINEAASTAIGNVR